MSSTLQSKFLTYYFNELRYSTLFQNMQNTVEDSPYHREKNVLVHTDMVVAQYLSLTGTQWTKSTMIGAFACAFHDVGKPDAEEEVLHRETNTIYRRYGGHEILSARLWETYACDNYDFLIEQFDFSPVDIYAVGWIIQYHLPYSTKKPEKLEKLYKTVYSITSCRVFSNCLIADCNGRISDDHDIKKDKVNEWITEFTTDMYTSDTYIDDVTGHESSSEELQKSMFVMIGASGSGKTTHVNKLLEQYKANVFSLDEFRLRQYSPNTADVDFNYKTSFEQSTLDKDFSNSSFADFLDKLSDDSYDALIVDNTNCSAKSRRRYLVEANKRNIKTYGVIHLNSLNTLLNRQQTRSDKTVPSDAVIRQYNATSYPSLGEFDEIIVLPPVEETN